MTGHIINRYISFCLILVFLLFQFCVPAQDEEKELKQFFERYKKSREKIHVLVAQFTQKTIYPDEIYTSLGKLIYIKPYQIIFHNEEPKKTVFISKEKIYEYEPEIKQLAIYDVDEEVHTDLFFLGFAEDIESVQKNYRITLIVVKDKRGKHGISIKPLEESEDNPFEELILYLRDKDFLPYRIRIVTDKEVQSVVDFEQIDINKKIQLSDVQITIPPTTSIVENDRLKEKLQQEKKFPESVQIPPEYLIPPPKSTDSSSSESTSGQSLPELTVRDLNPN